MTKVQLKLATPTCIQHFSVLRPMLGIWDPVQVVVAVILGDAVIQCESETLIVKNIKVREKRQTTKL